MVSSEETEETGRNTVLSSSFSMGSYCHFEMNELPISNFRISIEVEVSRILCVEFPPLLNLIDSVNGGFMGKWA